MLRKSYNSVNPQATHAKETFRLTTDPHLSLCSSRPDGHISSHLISYSLELSCSMVLSTALDIKSSGPPRHMRVSLSAGTSSESTDFSPVFSAFLRILLKDPFLTKGCLLNYKSVSHRHLHSGSFLHLLGCLLQFLHQNSCVTLNLNTV